MEKATFAAGCFWGIEDIFSKVEGVQSTTVGYTGGHMVNPSYEQVCSDTTGHAEAVEVVFNPQKISYEKLLDIFWEIHNPTTKNRQGPDIGTQYRSVIFFHSPGQEQSAKASKQKLASSGKWKESIVTEILPAKTFYPAEEYHQKYLEKKCKR